MHQYISRKNKYTDGSRILVIFSLDLKIDHSSTAQERSVLKRPLTQNTEKINNSVSLYCQETLDPYTTMLWHSTLTTLACNKGNA